MPRLSLAGPWAGHCACTPTLTPSAPAPVPISACSPEYCVECKSVGVSDSYAVLDYEVAGARSC